MQLKLRVIGYCVLCVALFPADIRTIRKVDSLQSIQHFTSRGALLICRQPKTGEEGDKAPVVALCMSPTRSPSDIELQQIDPSFLAGLPSLNIAGLSYTKFNNSKWQYIGKENNISVLCLDYTNLTDEGLQHIKRMKYLETLHVDGTCVSDAGMQSIASVTSLRNLSLRHTAVSVKGVELLRRLPHLRFLDLSYTSITPSEAIRLFSEMKQLKIIAYGNGSWIGRQQK